MRAAITAGPSDVSLQAVDDPRPGADDVVVRVGAVGLCGTDLHLWAGDRPDVAFPLRQGHEIGGTVHTLPPAYAGPLSDGDVVAVDPSMPCGTCRPCMRGRWPSCLRFRAIGVALAGGLADLVAVPTRQLHAAPGLTNEDAALVEPLSIAEMALHRAELTGDERLLVTGAGPIGLALTICAQRRGVPVLVSDPVARRRTLAVELGADLVVDPTTTSLSDAVAEWTDGHGADVALEASGARPALLDCVGSLGNGGRLVVVGVAAHDLVLTVPQVLFRGITVVGARCGLFPEALAVAAAHRDDVRRLVSHRFDLEDVAAAFTFAHDRADEAIKVLVTCEPSPETAT